MKIDAHMHIGSWDHEGFLGRACELEDAVAVLRECNLDGAAILPTDQCDNAGLLDAAIRVSSAADSPKLWFFPWVRPRHEEGDVGSNDLRWVEDNAEYVTGLKIHPSLSRLRITDESFAPAMELASANGWLVLVHCGRWQEIASYRFAVEAAQRYPKARFLLAHAGGDTPPLSHAACELVAETKVENVWFEFSGLREYWMIERNVARIGADRYLMGSDYCLAHPRMYLGAVAGMRLKDEEKERILGGNAALLFGAPVGGRR